MLLSALLLAPAAAPQFTYQFPDIERYEFEGHAEGDEYGATVTTIGDLDGDGTEDYAVGRPRLDGGFFGLENVGEVVLRSGRTGDELDTLFTAVNNLRLGASGIAGGFDNDNDGRMEIAVTGEGLGRVYVFEVNLGGTNSIVATIDKIDDMFYEELQFGISLANVGDVNGDGRDDLAIGVPERDVSPSYSGQFSAAGRVKIYSGADFSSLLTVLTDDVEDARFGTSIERVGDFNNDGIEELAIGAPGPAGSRVWLANPRPNGFPTFFADYGIPGEAWGRSLAALGDLDGGGRQELAVGSPNYDSGGGPSQGGRVTVIRLETGGIYWQKNTDSNDVFPGKTLAAGDMNGDGHKDVLTIRRDSNDFDFVGPAELVVLDGPTGDELAHFDAWAASGDGDFPFSPLATPVAVIPDPGPGSGPATAVVGYPTLEKSSGGVVTYDLDPFPAPPFVNVWTVDPTPGLADFTAISHATLLAKNGDKIEVATGSYGSFEVVDDVEINGPVLFFGLAEAESARVRGVSEAMLSRLSTLQLTAEGCERVHFLRMDTNTAIFRGCAEATMVQSSADSALFGNFPLGPGILVDDSFVQLRNVNASGFIAITAGDLPGLELRGESRVLATACTFLGGNPVDVNPGIIVAESSQLDLRGDASHVVDSEDPQGLVPGIQVEAGSSVRLSPSLPSIDVAGGGLVEFAPDVSPWLEFEGLASTGFPLALDCYDDLGAFMALVIGFEPTQLDLPFVVGAPVLVDPLQILPPVLVIGAGPDTPFEPDLPIPANPGLVGQTLEVQGFSLRLDGLYDGTNGGRVLIR
ncbi:MAG: VCBS repeat-containing protein [Planctomycetota bacterium]